MLEVYVVSSNSINTYLMPTVYIPFFLISEILKSVKLGPCYHKVYDLSY
jgi:hypothetical protein